MLDVRICERRIVRAPFDEIIRMLPDVRIVFQRDVDVIGAGLHVDGRDRIGRLDFPARIETGMRGDAVQSLDYRLEQEPQMRIAVFDFFQEI